MKNKKFSHSEGIGGETPMRQLPYTAANCRIPFTHSRR